MQRALELAAFGRGSTSPNPMVGAVVVHEGKIVGEGFHALAGGPHAEIDALYKAGSEARGATLYINLEPCSHQGRTPPCTNALIEAGIVRVVAALEDPFDAVNGKGFEALRKAGIEVETGILESESRQLNEQYFHFTLRKTPFISLKLAMSMDGRIADHRGQSRWITGEAARQTVQELRFAHDAVLVGSGTLAQDDPRLNVRLDTKPTKHLVRVVLDRDLKIAENARLFDSLKKDPVWIFTSPSASDGKKAQILKSNGCKIFPCEVVGNHLSWSGVLSQLSGEFITSVLVEGGGRVAASLVRENLVNKYYLFYAPFILGEKGVPAFSGIGSLDLKEVLRMKLESFEKIGSDWLATGYPDTQ